MRTELLYNPRLLCERLAELSIARRRRAQLRGTAAASLTDDHIDSLELLRLAGALHPTVVYDIGANVGTWTLLCKAVLTEVEVHAFEPLAQHHAGFAMNTAALSKVSLHQIALGSDSGRMPCHVTSLSDASSLLPPTDAAEREWQVREVAQVDVPVERLDDWRARTGAPWPSLLKLDVQGFEVEVLKGAADCLRHASAIIAEASFREFYAGQALFGDVVSFLNARGFVLHALGRSTAIGRPLVQTDALFLSRQVAR